jgi:hypothetical protein
MEKGRAASQVSQDKKGFFYGLFFVSGKENVIQEEKKPMHQSPDGPDEIEKQQEFDPFASEVRGRVSRGEKRTVGCPPEETKVVMHLS